MWHVWAGLYGETVCLCVCCGVLDCISCCTELICEIELCLHTAAPAAWHSVCVCVCVCVCCWMALVMVNERSERERRQMDRPEGQETERGRERGKKKDRKRGRQGNKERREKCQLKHTHMLTHIAHFAFLHPLLFACIWSRADTFQSAGWSKSSYWITISFAGQRKRERTAKWGEHAVLGIFR